MGKALYVTLHTRSRNSFRAHENSSRATKRLLHAFTQSVEMRLENNAVDLLEETCPEARRGACYHPLLKSSRMRGSTVLREALLNRFAKKASGFLTTKDEPTVGEMGLAGKNSKVASATVGEFLMRFLAKMSSRISASCQPSNETQTGIRLLNWSMDAARCCTFQAGSHPRNCRFRKTRAILDFPMLPSGSFLSVPVSADRGQHDSDPPG